MLLRAFEFLALLMLVVVAAIERLRKPKTKLALARNEPARWQN